MPDLEHLTSTKCDFSSIMQVMGVRTDGDTQAYTLHPTFNPPADYILPVFYALSVYDQANIALMYPGANLLTGEKRSDGLFALAMEKSNTKICYYGRRIGLDDSVIILLETCARRADWPKLRESYLGALKLVMKSAFESRLDKLREETPPASGVTKSPQHSVPPPPRPPITQPARDAPTVPPPVKPPITRPARDAPPTATGGANSGASFANTLYDKINSLFNPLGSQYLALQLPSRYVHKGTFEYKASGIYSNFIKPSTSFPFSFISFN